MVAIGITMVPGSLLHIQDDSMADVAMEASPKSSSHTRLAQGLMICGGVLVLFLTTLLVPLPQVSMPRSSPTTPPPPGLRGQ